MRGAILALGLLTCASPTFAQANKDWAPDHAVKIRTYRDGHIDVDGKVVELSQVDGLIKQGAAAKKTVWYYRDQREMEPTAAQKAAFMSIMQSVTSANTKIALAAKPDFSEFLDDKGRAHPR